MAPIRRYLRISKFSVLECRIYLDNPALAQSWLLNPRDPVLPRVIESVRPLVLPKLREEKERTKKKSTKKRGIKDVVIEDDFEVSIFLTETQTRHSLLYKHKHFRDKVQTKLTSNSSKLIGLTREAPIDVEDNDMHVELQPLQDGDEELPGLRREESDDQPIALDDIPVAEDATAATETESSRRSKRRRTQPIVVADSDDEASEVADEDEEGDDSFASSGDESTSVRPTKRRKEASEAADAAPRDEKKKLAMDISYEGFAIYGRVLCLVVKRRGPRAGGATGGATAGGGSKSQTGQAFLEKFITSTQMPAGVELEEGPEVA